MDQINSEILRQFENQGLTINEGIAVDARLVKSASRPISNDQIKELKDKRNAPEGKLDKNGKPLKFTRDLESDWVVQNDKPHYGLKEHASVDINHGFILATTMTPASRPLNLSLFPYLHVIKTMGYKPQTFKISNYSKLSLP
jgi:IS5 family transposase